MESPLFLIATAIAILVTGISKSGFGGVAMLAVPIMSMSDVSPFTAAGIMLPILLLMDGMSIAGHWRKWDMFQLMRVLPGALVGVVIGGLTAEYASADMARLLVGGLAVAFVVWANRPVKEGVEVKPFGAWAGRLLGMLAGYTSFVAHAGGPPMQTYMLTQKVSKEVFAATGVIFFTIVNLAKLPPFLMAGLVTEETLFWSLVFAPLAPLGVWLGLKLNKRLDPKLFFRIIHVMLAGLGVKLIHDGIQGVMAAPV